jgi:O-antigen/teichoic acid export membrane protein
MEKELNSEQKAELNIASSLVSQLVTLVCGFVLPQLIIGTYGSEAYGATTSIAQFLGYISLVEGGVCGVARAALYKPLAINDVQGMSQVVYQIKHFFRVIGYIFIAYVFVLAFSYKFIARTDLDWIFTFLLVLVISISTLAQYFIGISYSVFLQADQKSYITNICSIVTVILNTVMTVILVKVGCNLVIVKLFSGCIFVIRPLVMYLYVKRKYALDENPPKGEDMLKSKWTGLGQHLAFFLHSNTDVAVLTVFEGLKSVSVYSVYHMIVYNIQNFTTSFSNGLEALFGSLIAKNERDRLLRVFSYYDTLISTVSVSLFTITAIMIVPFIKIYTKNLTDANYIEPIFAILLTLACMTYCLRIPYHEVTIAAGHFKKTCVGAYGEAAINIVLSIILVFKFGLIGVAVGTIVADVYRFVYYIVYLHSHILHREIWIAVKRELVNYGLFFACFRIGTFICDYTQCDSYLSWIWIAVKISLIVLVLVLWVNYVFYKHDFRFVISKICQKLWR